MLLILPRDSPGPQGTSIAGTSAELFTEDGTMHHRFTLVGLTLATCLCSTLFQFALAGPLNASDRMKQGRHSLIARPSIMPHSKPPRSETQPAEVAKPLSLVVPIRPATDR